MPHLFKLSVFTAGLAFQDSAKQAAGELVSHIYSARGIYTMFCPYMYMAQVLAQETQSP